MNYPKISVVTPNFNGGAYLEETILSVLGQNYPNLEYIIIDGGSTDNSKEIIEKYSDRLAYWCCEADNGLYHAVQKGFERSSGDIMTWLNSDDLLHRNALFAVAEIFQLEGVHWITGMSNVIDERSRSVWVGNFKRWSKCKQPFDQRLIQQEGTFWSRNLWNKSGAHLSLDYQYAADFELWSRFFCYENLYSVRVLLGSFRIRSTNQISLDFWTPYQNEMANIRKAQHWTKEEEVKLRKIKKIQQLKMLLRISILFNLNSFLVRLNFREERLYGFPPLIEFNRSTQTYLIQNE